MLDLDWMDYLATGLGLAALVLTLALPTRLHRLGVPTSQRPAAVVATARVPPASWDTPTADMRPYLDGYADGWADAAAGRPPSP